MTGMSELELEINVDRSLKPVSISGFHILPCVSRSRVFVSLLVLDFCRDILVLICDEKTCFWFDWLHDLSWHDLHC